MRWLRVCALLGAVACGSSNGGSHAQFATGPVRGAKTPGAPVAQSDCLQEPRAVARLDEDADRDFNRADSAYRIGVELASSGDHVAARQAFQRAVASDPMHGLAHLALAEMHLYTDNDQPTMHRHLGAAVVLLPENPRAHVKFAELEADRARADVAIRHWHCALALKPGIADAHYGLARTFLVTGAVDRAETSVRAALVIDPRNVKFQMLLADVLEAKGESLDAARAAEAAAGIVARSAALFRRAGALYAAAGDDVAASRVRRQADEIDPPAEDRKLRPLRKARKKRVRKHQK